MLIAILKKAEDLEPAEKLADGFEIRVDCFENIDTCIDILRKTSLPIIFTVRKKSQGGFFFGSEEERLHLIEKLFSLKPQYFDLEYDTDASFVRKLSSLYPDVKIICSYHNFINTPEDLSSVLASMKSPVFHGYKIATMALSTLDALRMLLFVKEEKEKGERLAGIAMGEKGQVSRILGSIMGSLFTYAPTDISSALPGQLTLSEFHNIYNFKTLGPKTEIYGLIGNPVDKSVGHYVHNAVIKASQLNAVYIKMEVLKEELKEFFILAKKLNIAGLSVTMPLKEQVIPFIDDIEDSAKKIGALNTICFEKGRMCGYNTDGHGAIDAIKKNISLQGKRVIILGSGGSAKAIAHVAWQNGSDLIILNRSLDKAKELAACVNGKFGSLEEMPTYAHLGYDVLINCTPNFLPIARENILESALIMDINTRPEGCLLLHEAMQKKAKVVFGYEMFMGQALSQQEIWFKEKINKEMAKQIIADVISSYILH